MTSGNVPAAKGEGATSGALPGLTRFHITAIATQRARQLQLGARPRIVDAAGHKPTRVALLEVLANTVSWDLAEKPVPRPG